MDEFRVYLTSRGLKAKTVNNKLVAVKNLLKYAKTRKFISRDMADDAIDILEPLKEPKRIDEKENFFANGEEDVRKFISTFDAEDTEWRVPVLTLFYGALRLGEWQAITRECLNFDNDFIVISKQIDNHGKLKDHTKTGHDRIVRLPSPFMLELKEYVEQRAINDDEFIFMGANGAHVSRRKIRDIVNKHLLLANLTHITLHGLRHSFATRMFDKGYDVKEVQEHLGHTSMETTMKYYIHYTRNKKKDLEDLL
jgi:integrase